MPEPEPAPVYLRLAAMVYDLFALIGVWMACGALMLLLQGSVDVAHPPAWWRWSLRGLLLAASGGYFVLSWRRGGQTLGMRAWRIRVTAADGGALSWWRAGLRFVLALVSALPAGAGFVPCLVRPDRRAWHDLAAGTQVLRVPR